MDSENHTCVWCKSPTRKVTFSWSESNFKMVCDKCVVDYKFKNGRFSGISVRRTYNGEDYVYRSHTYCIGLVPNTAFVLSRVNKDAKSPLDYFHNVHEVDIYTFSPDRALEDIPKHLGVDNDLMRLPLLLSSS